MRMLEIGLKTVQSALTHLLTTSGPRGTLSRLSTKRGCIPIIELLQFTVVRSFWASLGNRAINMGLREKKTHNYVGTDKF